ncbi:hypothetical protein BBP40_002173 [Aspergillus hancockii]|nr:hypothetical protein BBP40_002173 [Aspergillus hancockii]
MKFSTALIATSALLSGANAAALWSDIEGSDYAKKFGHCWTCCKSHGSSVEEDDNDELYRWL